MSEPKLEKPSLSWEKDVIEKYVFSLHKEQVRDRRWRTLVSVIRSAAFVLIAIAIILIALNPDGGFPWNKSKDKEPHTAYINISGNILPGTLSDADHIIPALNKAFENEEAKGVVLRINSPGGSPVQANQIYSEVKALRKLHPEKKVYAVIDDIGASGGYFIAASADEIYADPTSLVGSIGVISSGFGFTELMDKLGIERRAITAGRNKALLDPFAPLTKETEAFWKKVLAKTHEQFIQRVRDGRGDRLIETPDIFSGLIWNGEQAQEIGLIDGLGSLQTVAREIVGETELVDYTPNDDLLKRFTNRAKVEAKTLMNEINPLEIY